MTDRTEVKVLGKIIGTMSGWDEVDNQAYIFYDFEPNDLGTKFIQDWTTSETSLVINYVEGTVAGTRDDTDNVNHTPYWRVFE
jgi:hypothetical protein